MCVIDVRIRPEMSAKMFKWRIRSKREHFDGLGAKARVKYTKHNTETVTEHFSLFPSNSQIQAEPPVVHFREECSS